MARPLLPSVTTSFCSSFICQHRYQMNVQRDENNLGLTHDKIDDGWCGVSGYIVALEKVECVVRVGYIDKLP